VGCDRPDRKLSSARGAGGYEDPTHPRYRIDAVRALVVCPRPLMAVACTTSAKTREECSGVVDSRSGSDPSVIDWVANDPRAVRGGASASARGVALDVMAPGEAEVHVRAEDVDACITDHTLNRGDQANIVVRVPPADLWFFDAADASWPVVAVDLLDQDDERSARAAHELSDGSRR
jgi:hypothetical protein